ncbi:hypothetical protein CKM354_001128200 [Cercospora kikuchii]|nr:uncharacterized protein CKM354_001128200 [Cercospora kikuchii]GIZ48213.1 hypothetical protein CKM354_001128200 [Cercospora kikuchii]
MDIAAITSIPERVLRDYAASTDISVNEKLRWMEGRATTKPEDMSYALYGIFGVTPGANYGERHEGARRRLLAAIHHQDDVAAQKTERFQMIVEWLSSPDPWTNHQTARQLHEPLSGAWLLQSDLYQDWKNSSTRHLWMHGKPGCGKTVLCSTAIEDIKEHCQNCPNAGYAIFYFSFSETQKQQITHLLRSLIVQLGWREPAFSILKQLYNRPNRIALGLGELERTLLACFEAYDTVFLLLDALDESPEDDDVRCGLLEWIVRASQKTSNVQIFATGRKISDIEGSMAKISAEPIAIAPRAVDVDIRRYIATQLDRNHWLSRMDEETKALIEDTISDRADGMFRWAYLQLQELKKLKSARRKLVKDALYRLPPTLDATYERILVGISDEMRDVAVKLLRWLAYAQYPLSLYELVDATTIVLSDEEYVEVEERPGEDDLLAVLSGLVTVIDSEDVKSQSITNSHHPFPEMGNTEYSKCQQVEKNTRIRLAHFTVKEYLESKRIVQSSAKGFHFESAKEQETLAKSCLVYLEHYSSSSQKLADEQDLTTFPLLRYAAESWYHHSIRGRSGDCSRERSLLCNPLLLSDWLNVHQPDLKHLPRFSLAKNIGSSLYYASLIGLVPVVHELIEAGANVNAMGGHYGNALQAASYEGQEKVVRILLDGKANIDATGGHHSNALQAAATRGHVTIVRMLLDAGADIHANGLDYRSALHVATQEAHANVVQMLLERGARMTSDYNNMTPLHYAVQSGQEKIAKLILDSGTDVDLAVHRQIWLSTHEGNGKFWTPTDDPNRPSIDRAKPNSQRGLTPLHYAALVGSATMTKFLLDQNADADAKSDYGETPLHLAVEGDLHGPDWLSGNEDYWNDPAFRIEYSLDLVALGSENDDEYYMVQCEVDHFRSEVIDLLCSHYSTKPCAKDFRGATPLHSVRYGTRISEFTLQSLFSRDFAVNQRDCSGRTALHLACSASDRTAIELLESHGAALDAVDNLGMNALHHAAHTGNHEMIQMALRLAARQGLIGFAAEKDSSNRNALHILLESCLAETASVQLLIKNGADLNDRTDGGYSPLALHLCQFLPPSQYKAKIAEVLLEHGADPLFKYPEDDRNLAHLAASADEVGVILLRVLANCGVDLAAKDHDDRTIFHHCAIAGSLTEDETFSFLRYAMKVSHTSTDRFGETPLHLAIKAHTKTHDPHLFRPDRWQSTMCILMQ